MPGSRSAYFLVGLHVSGVIGFICVVALFAGALQTHGLTVNGYGGVRQVRDEQRCMRTGFDGLEVVTLAFSHGDRRTVVVWKRKLARVKLYP